MIQPCRAAGSRTKAPSILHGPHAAVGFAERSACTSVSNLRSSSGRASGCESTPFVETIGPCVRVELLGVIGYAAVVVPVVGVASDVSATELRAQAATKSRCSRWPLDPLEPTVRRAACTSELWPLVALAPLDWKLLVSSAVKRLCRSEARLAVRGPTVAAVANCQPRR